VLLNLVNLTTTQVETLFGELEYIEPKLKILGLGGSVKEQNAKAIDNTSYDYSKRTRSEN